MTSTFTDIPAYSLFILAFGTVLATLLAESLDKVQINMAVKERVFIEQLGCYQLC
jgi:hypothetical protein